MGQNGGMPAGSLTILIIDENHMRASMIEAGLREAGYDNLTLIHDVAASRAASPMSSPM